MTDLLSRHKLVEHNSDESNFLAQPDIMLLARPVVDRGSPLDVLQEVDDATAVALPNNPLVRRIGNAATTKLVHVVPASSLEDDDCESLDSSEYSSDFDDEDDGSSISSDEEEEDQLVKRLVEYAFASKQRSNNLKRPLQETPLAFMTKKPRLNGTTTCTCPTPTGVGSRPSSSPLSMRMNISASAPNLLINVSETFSATKTTQRTNLPVFSPQEYLQQMFHKAGVTFRTASAMEVKDFFVPSTGEYDMAMVQAVRNKDLDLLRQMHDQQGRSLQCANKFGESTVHTASRHGATAVLQLLLELGVTVQVRCDSGRTPLHDACWTVLPPHMNIVDVLLDACPDLLYMTDQRGLAPLSYVPREHWDAWCHYLEDRGIEKLMPLHSAVVFGPNDSK